MPPRKKSTEEPKAKTGATRAKKAAPKKAPAPAELAQAAAPVRRTSTRKKPAAETPASRPAPSGKSLVIVESPAKAKTIQKYLGPNFEVAASYGHVRDLPKNPRGSDIGIDIAAGWVPTYEIIKDERHDKNKVLADLKKKADRAGIVYLAPDPDREGEAIAWHLKEALKLDDDRVLRVTFNEITKRAVQDAFQHAGTIDMDRVRAQEARRFLDRAVGYKLSPLLRKKIARGLSAGRVQSVAVRLIVEREREIEKFRPEEYWDVTAHLAPESTGPLGQVKLRVVKKAAEKVAAEGDGEPAPEPQALKAEPGKSFLAELAEWEGQKIRRPSEEGAGLRITSEEQAVALGAALESAAYLVTKIEQKDRAEKPQAPFTTSTLQQEANRRLGFTAKHTMSLAQKLYEGVELGSEGAVALITYMRTDSTRVSDEALKSCREHIQGHYGDAYLPAEPNRYSSGKSAQEAHEAIRPTDLAYTPQRVAPFLSEQQRKLYELIYRRFVASQMKPAIFAVTSVQVTADRGLFKATGKVMKFDGYRRVLAPRHKEEDATLPPLSEQQKLALRELVAGQHFTQPPPRYNEASLVKQLESEGIGRPSTYATIINTIQTRGYVELKERRFYATPMGKVVTDKLVAHFPKVMDMKFTSHMEEELDEIEERKVEWHQVLDDFWGPFSEALEAAKAGMEAVKGVETGENCPKCSKPLVTRYSAKRKGNQFVGCSGYPDCKYIKPGEGEEERPEPVETEHKCPTCGKPMIQRMGRRGVFLGCSGYPECKTTMNLDAQGNPVLSSRPTEHVCDKCGKPMVLREGPRGLFLACSGYPKCRNAKDVDAQGNPVKPIDTGVVCDKCGKPMNVKRGPRGPFLGCSGYPGCKSTKPVPEELKEKLKELMPARPKKELPKVEIHESCPECGAAMELRNGRKGYFLGCTQFAKTKCKGTREVPAEVMEQLQASSV